MIKESKFALQLQESICNGCMSCVSRCAFNAIVFNQKPEINAHNCRLCGACVKACPTNALVLKRSDVLQNDNTNGVWVLVEIENDEIAPVTFELLGKAAELSKELGQKVEAILVGNDVLGYSDLLIYHGADTVHVVDHVIFEQGIEEHYVEVLSSLAKKIRPNILLVGATEQGRGVSARLAATLKTGLTADCTSLNVDKKENLLLQCRPAFGGNLMATIKTPIHRPQMASVRPGVMRSLPCDKNRKGKVMCHDFDDFVFDDRIKLINQSVSVIKEAQISDSKIIIGIGRGVKRKETVEQIYLLAKKLNAVVAGSRAAVEVGLIDSTKQVGQTGHTISPDLYIAIGISGQIQHSAAITGAGKIIAINRDFSAPIFNYADYGWVGAIEDVLPKLVDSLHCK